MKLSDFKDEKAIEVVANLLVPIGKIAANKETAAAKGKSKLEFASAMLKNNAGDVKDMLAILNDVDPAEYHCSAASVLADLLDMLNDPELMQLFGLQSKTPASSGSASESTEGQEE
jgi:hypothetical protein